MPARRLPGIRRPGLLGQIGLALAAVGLLPLGVAVQQLAGVNREALYEQLLRTHSVAARSSAEAIEAHLAPRRGLAEALAADLRLGAGAGDEAAQTAVRDALATWSDTGVVALGVFDAEGRPLVRAQQRGAAEVAEQGLARPTAAPTELLRAAGALWARFATARPAGGEARVLADATALERALAPDELGEQARLLLVERSGRILIGDPAEFAALAPAVREAVRSGRVAGASRFTAAGASERVAAWAFTDQGRWALISTQPTAIAAAAARRMARRTVWAVALAAVLVSALSLAAWRWLVRPVRALLVAQRRLAGLSPAPSAGAEIRQLAGTLATLERHTKDRAALDEVFLGRYQVLELLGSGGMGTVFRGWDPRLQRPVALKTIHLEPGGDSRGSTAGLLAEAVSAAQVIHSNVVAIYDAQESEDLAFVAMEYVHGVGLDHYLEARGRLDWREVVPLGRAVALGLAAAHARGLVHRDVKPGNVLLGHDGSIKVADFGLAQFVGARTARLGRVFGTPGFLAPEALVGKPYDQRCDLFALGVLMYRSITGSYPFTGASFREIVVTTVRGATPRPDSLGAELPASLADLVCGLLEKDPERRFGPASRVAEGLERLGVEHRLDWRLDFTRAERPIAASEVFRSVQLPTLPLSGELP